MKSRSLWISLSSGGNPSNFESGVISMKVYIYMYIYKEKER